MVDTPILRFNFAPADQANDLADGYGTGTLLLNDQPFWFSNTTEAPTPVEWTWVDFLEHLALIWPALSVEQNYPFDWLNKSALHPGEMWERAESRWSRMGDDVADEEEPTLYAFHNRHNLAAGWKGLCLPSLYWLRVGHSVWLSPEGGTPILAEFSACMQSLEAIGDQLASCFRGSLNVRVAAAVGAWHARQQALAASFLNYATGLNSTELAVIENGIARQEFWEITSFHDWQSAAANDSEILAVARMTKGIVKAEVTASLIERIRQLPQVATPKLDELGLRAVTHLKMSGSKYVHEAGYCLAVWLRQQLHLDVFTPFEIESYLSELGINIINAQFATDHIEAMACLGKRGPVVILNEDRAYHDKQRLRMTLAHELCHFLLDRHTALPVAEVMGGSVDLCVERRANAFAAELLLPRAAVVMASQRGETDLHKKLALLQQHFGVSKAVACAQIFNSSEFSLLTRREQDYVQTKISRLGELKFLDERIISEIF